MTTLRTALTAVLAAAASAGLPTSALAQGLEEIIITAQRRAQSLQDVPLAVSAFTPDALQDLQIRTALDLVDLVPNMQGGNYPALGSANMYFLRGQGQDESFATFDPAVGVYVDEVYVARQNANNFNFFEVERVEVLRGPQGTLFGKNTTGGAVNIVMRKPGDKLAASFEAGYGRFDRTMFRASLDMPLSDTGRSLLSLFSVQDDGWANNTALGGAINDKDAMGARMAFSFDLSDKITWDLIADYVDDSGTNITGNLVGKHVVSSSRLPAGLSAVYPGQQSKAGYGSNTKSGNFISNFQWQFDSGTANLILGSRQIDQEFLVNFPRPNSAALLPASPEDVFIIDNLGAHDQLSAELKWTGSYQDGDLNLVAGIFVLSEDNETDVAAYFGGPTPSRDRVIENNTTNRALYMQGDYNINDQWTATMGVRFTFEDKDISVRDNRPVGDITDLTSANLDTLGISRKIEENVVTPRFALAWQPTDDALYYFSATRGFRTGGWNARANTAAGLRPFESEFAWSYEGGAKLSLGETVALNATLFHLNVDDLQVNTATGGGTFLIGNAGEMDNTGLEVELFYQPNDRFNLYLATGMQNPEYDPSAADRAACTAPNTRFGAFDMNCNVAEVTRAPDWTVSLGASYNIPIPAWGATLQPRLSVNSTPDHVTASFSRGLSNDYTLYNAGVDLNSDDDTWGITAECSNCDDERYVIATFGAGDLYYNQPGRWDVRFRYKFSGD